MKRKTTRVLIILIMLSGLLTIMSSVLSSVVELPLEVKRLAWPLLLLVTVALVGLTVWQFLLQREPQAPQLAMELQNRRRLLARVRTMWIDGVLKQSLHGAALIALGLKEQQEAVADPWRLAFQEPDQLEHDLAPGTPITDVYDSAGEELLILGEPGVGKTTLLLELTRDLLKRANDDENYPIPVVFNLSSWAVKQLPLTEWLIEELDATYRVPQPIGQSWVKSDQILPLLDGLDEVAEKVRAACVDAINNYRKEHGLLPTVVCSRSTEYHDLIETKHRLQLHSAVVVQSLTEQQIDDYLSSAGGQLAAIRVALREDKILQELAKTPLMINILILAYRGKSVEDLLMKSSSEIRRRQIFAAYIQRMLQRRSTPTHYLPQQTTHWLTWLAYQLTEHHQSQLYLEDLQPDWLPEGQKSFYRGSFGLLGGLLSGLVLLLVLDLLGRPFFGRYLFYGLLGGLPFGLVSGLVVGQVIGQVSRRTGRPAQARTWSWRAALSGLADALGGVLIFGLLAGLLFWMFTLLFGSRDDDLLGRLLFQISFGLVGGLVVGPTRALTNSMRVVLFGLGGLAVGLLFGLVVGPTKARTWSWRDVLLGLLGGLSVGLLFGGLGGLFGGLVVGQVIGQVSRRTGRPAQARTWSWKAALSGLSVGPIVGLGVGLLFWLFTLPSGSLGDDLLSGLLFQISFGLVGGLLSGLVTRLVVVLVHRRAGRPTEALTWSWRDVLFGLGGALGGALLLGMSEGVGGASPGLFYWLFSRLFYWLFSRLEQRSFGGFNGLLFVLVLWLLFGLLFGLFGGLVIGLLSRRANMRIEPTEALTWSWRRGTPSGLVNALGGGLLFGLLFGVLGGLFGGLGVFGLLFGVLGGPLLGLIIWLLVMLPYKLVGSGVIGKQLPRHLHFLPNEGIRRSTTNGLRVGLIGGLFGSLGGGLLFGLGGGPLFGLVAGLSSGLGVGLFFGLDATVQHYLLRYFLWRSGAIPWHYVRFLDYAAECVLLRKVGGGYIFVHRLLQDYFASLNDTPTV